jgi:hypothetical protein
MGWLLGPPPSGQQALFWLDRHGPHVCLYVIRLLTLLISMYFAVLTSYLQYGARFSTEIYARGCH